MIIIKVFLPLAFVATVAHAESDMFAVGGRTRKLEVSGFGEYQAAASTTTFSSGASVKFGSGFGGGVSMGYNFNEHFNLNTDIAGTSMGITGQSGGQSISGKANVFNWNINIDYNLLKTRFTPFLTAGAGLTYFNGNFGVSGSEFSEADLSFGGGGGIRWDISDHWYLKAVYRATWTNIKDSSSPTLFHNVTVGIGYMF